MLIIPLKDWKKRRYKEAEVENRKKVKRYEPKEMNQNKQQKRMHKLMY